MPHCSKMFKLVPQVFKYHHRNFSAASALPTPMPKPPLPETGIFINNEYHKPCRGEVFETVNPATGEVTTHVYRGRKEDVDLAVEAAVDAFKLGSPWRRMDASKRGMLVNKLADLMERDIAILASLETVDVGSPYTLETEFTNVCIKTLRYFAGWADKHKGQTISMDGNYFAYTRYEPVGVCGQIIPCNVPLINFAGVIAPALVTGNTIVMKPAAQTPLSALHMGKLIREAGFPPGVVNIVPGFADAGEAICCNTNVDKLTFSGSTAVGMKIQQASGTGNLKRTTLGLSAKNPIIVLPDADVPLAVELAHNAAFRNQGQLTSSGSRTYVHDSIYNDFVQQSADRANSRVLGDPFDPKTQQGPQIDAAHVERIQSMVQCAVKEGACLVAGGSKCGGIGFYFQPTVFAEVEDHHTIAREEVFGPVQNLIRFDTLDEVICRANNSSYGFAAGIFTKDIDKINYLAHRIRVGTLWVNCYFVLGPQAPFGGYKNSGLGDQNGEYGLREYTEVKTIVTGVREKNS